MPIPPFDPITNVLPPHSGDPRDPAQMSPYYCTVEELCDRFATSTARKRILQRFLDFRSELFALGIKGFQWLDGSLVENIEMLEAREPADIDVITFVGDPADPVALNRTMATTPNLLNRTYVKSQYFVDHFWVPLGSTPALIVDQTRYWCALFSHRRNGLWKGMLVVDLINPMDDQAAAIILGGRP